MPDNVLLPLDLGHKTSWEKALPVARQMAGDKGTVHVLGIVQDVGSSMVATFLPKNYEKKALEAMKAALQEFVATNFEKGAKVATHVGHGHVADTILKQAKKLDADLIVMASHKPDELRSFLLGSQANHIVRHSPVSVYIVR